MSFESIRGWYHQDIALITVFAQEGAWTTGQDSKEKMQIREEAARKRERAMAYAFSQQVCRSV